ncbi:hypothetical protein BOX15_Mlig010859g1 [Macrostomum lignano]|uniref:Tetraspanin n=1 Tax=Macrostomum lignano TaxID=282301 RepID=A0A267DW87_9PLAT|nr:hypothetical protein BOX15_Mlig010859g3 [Macrostomum lignano]PAA64731.1 hypothetical protein BOX15_Mlig010859g2 [Macrostomum lignano]PAA73610.1 hypothetical protein BOX15_Mlig010859g1 [Macrostomum lignano]
MGEVDYAAIRFLFIGAITASLIFSVGIISLGVWILADASLLSFWLNKIVITDYGALTVSLRVSSYMPIGLGLVATISFGLGLLHVLRGGKALLVAYMVFTAIAIVLEIVLAIVPMGMWRTVETELPTYMKSTLQSEYRGISEGSDYPNSIIWDVMQIQLECCGYNGPSDFTTSYGTYASLWHNQYRHYKADGVTYSGVDYMFPVSCCKFSDKSITAKQDFANYESYVGNKQCPVTGVDYHSNSCQEPMKSYVYVYFSVILAASIVMLVVHSVSIFLSAYLFKKRLVPAGRYRPMSSVSSSLGLRSTNSGKVSPLSWHPRGGGAAASSTRPGYARPATFSVSDGRSNPPYVGRW